MCEDCKAELDRACQPLNQQIVDLSAAKGWFLGMAYGLSQRAMHDATCAHNVTSINPRPDCNCSLAEIRAELKKEMGL